MIVFIMWVRWTLPRFRYDQLMDLAWKSLIPLALLNLVVTAAIVQLIRGSAEPDRSDRAPDPTRSGGHAVRARRPEPEAADAAEADPAGEDLPARRSSAGLAVTGRHILGAAVRRQGDHGAVPRGAARPVAPNYRGVHRLNKDEQGRVKCVACMLCATACPAHCIDIVGATAPETWPDREKYPESFVIDELRCIYCGMCEEACPVDAIELTGLYDLTGLSREQMIFDKAKLLSVFDVTKDAEPMQYRQPAAGAADADRPPSSTRADRRRPAPTTRRRPDASRPGRSRPWTMLDIADLDLADRWSSSSGRSAPTCCCPTGTARRSRRGVHAVGAVLVGARRPAAVALFWTPARPVPVERLLLRLRPRRGRRRAS